MTYSNYLNATPESCQYFVAQSTNSGTKIIQEQTDTIQNHKDNLNKTLKKYGLENRFDVISTIIGEELTDKKLSVMQDKDITQIIESLEKAFKECQNPITKKIDLENVITKAQNYFILAQNKCDTDNSIEEKATDINGILKNVLGDKANLESLSETEKQNAIKKYFEDKLNEYQKQGKTNPEEELKKDFTKLLLVLPDKDKKLLLKVVLEVFTTTSVVSQFFDSIKNNELRMEVADSVTYEQYKTLGEEQQKEITKYMSAPGTEKLLSELETEARDYYFKNKDALEQIYKKDDSELTDEERIIKNTYEKLAKIISNAHEGMLRNENLDDENKQKLTERIFDIFKGTPYQERYIQNLAESLSKSELAAKYKDILDKATDNKFSEELSKVKEKSAIDSETRMFKTAKPEEIAQQQVIAAEKRDVVLRNTEKASGTDDIVIVKDEPENTSTATTEKTSYFDNFGSGFKAVKGFLNGKTDGFESGSDQHEAIEKYSNMNYNEQLLILQSSILGKYFRKCIEEAKFVTLKKLHDLNLVASDSYNTEFAEQMYEEQKNKRNMAS